MEVESRPMELERLIQEAQSGNQEAKNELVKKMFDDGYIRQLNKYLYLNRLLKPNEVRSEFWYGVLRAMSKVKYRLSPPGEPDTNNPLQFLAFKGIMRVKTALRNRIRKGVFYSCRCCGHQSQLKSLVKLYIRFKCHECGSEDIETYEREILMENNKIRQSSFSRREMDRTINERDKIKRFRQTLHGKQRETFDWIIGGLTRYNSKNYLVEIAELMNCTPQCINIYLNKIREKYKNFV